MPVMRSHPRIQPLALGLSLVLCLWCLFTPSAAAQTPSASMQPYLDRVKANITEFTLDNGLKFIVLERHDAPVVSFATYADVGGVDEPDGQTGVAHFLEHLAFKGTTKIGTRDYAAEVKLLDQLDDLNAQIKAAQTEGDTDNLDALNAQFEALQAEAGELAIQNQFGQIVEQAGGVGLNAATSADYTIYTYSLPSNKLELWMSLESERFLDPVFREFFKEQQVILEERRWRTDNSPVGQMVEAFLDAAYTAHPYGRPVIGYNEDIRNLTRQNVHDFFETYYVPNNLTVAIVGDVQPRRVKQLAQTYFGRYPSRPEAPEVTVVEPPQTEPRSVTLKLESEPWYLEGYHRPNLMHPDSMAYDLMAAILSDGRTSRLYKSLVQEQQVALSAAGFGGFPGDKYPNMLLFYAMTAPGQDVETVATALHGEIERLKTEPVTAQELERVKNQAKAGLLRSLDSNSGMSRLLSEYDGKTGDWRNVFRYLDAIDTVTPAQIQRIAQETFVPTNQTIGKILNQNTPN
ncbi:pitrilysin family protein [Spirulina subsalsa CS-330]|uniref:M16 family metallopeptidase n=1 Tax=Spirulina TaxID=1154 RepID=UPI003A8F7506|nr:pitrilysin family protein [Spirulina subsalsa CS-330]